MVNPHLGKLVRSEQNGLGIGKLVDSNRESVQIEYFDSPVATVRPIVSLPWTQVQQVKKLGEQTRVYYIDGVAKCWRIGRVQQHVEDGDIFIDLPNGGHSRVAERDVYVRWDRPLPDPWEHLAAQLTETPFFHTARAKVIQHVVSQRAAVAGMTALISAPIEIEPHQVEVIRRVLLDPVPRYLLADEVGLGKTIEAGVIARQHILDQSTQHHVMVVAPESLVDQWKDELRIRCQIDATYGHRLSLVSVEEVADWNGDPPTLLIIDEAHQAVSGWQEAVDDPRRRRFEALRRLSAPNVCPGLLLLSATPIRRNEAGFLAMLHLLEPAVYSLANRAAFQLRVEKRQEIADLLAAFTEEQQVFFLTSTAEELAKFFASDARLQQMLGELAPLLDNAADADQRRLKIRAIRTHVSDTYRLHRRMLRNRRNDNLAGLLPGRAGFQTFGGDDIGRSAADDLLEVWRTRAAAAVWNQPKGDWATGLAQVLVTLLEASWIDIDLFAACIRVRQAGRLTKPVGTGVWSEERGQGLAAVPRFEGEDEILGEIERAVPNLRAVQRDRLKRIAVRALELSGEGIRVVCMASSPTVADDLLARLDTASPKKAGRHNPKDPAWRGHWETVPGAILVCDFRAEEGVNLQGKRSTVLHVDLPLAPNRLEQRMGRLDRYGVGKAVPSLAASEPAESYAAAWARCLDEGWGVFRRSIAALQYVVEDVMRQLVGEIFQAGPSAIDRLTERLKASDGILAKELRSIRNQDELDALDLPPIDSPESLVDRIESIDHVADGFRRAFEDWFVSRLQFTTLNRQANDSQVVAYAYRSSTRGAQTLMSQYEMVRWLRWAIDPFTRPTEFGLRSLRPMSFQRQVAIHRHVALARIGSPLVDGLGDYLRADDRGTAFAFWRETKLLAPEEIRLWFRFDFLVEADLPEDLPATLGVGAAGRRAIRRQADAALAPFQETVWIDHDFQDPTDAVREELEEVYVREVDVNLNHERWPKALTRFGGTGWSDLCTSVRRAAEKTLRQRRSLKALTQTAQAAYTTQRAGIREQLLSRGEALAPFPVELAHFQAEVAVEEAIAGLIAAGILRPRVNLDAVGVIFLAGSKL